MYLLHIAASSENWTHKIRILVYGIYIAVFWFTPKWIKFCGYYSRFPEDIKYIPFHVLFGYFHMFLKGYGMLTMHVVGVTVSPVT